MKISSLCSFRPIRDTRLGKRISKSTLSFRSAFTLIEILVVISIIAVLASLLFPAMGAVRDSARRTSAKNDVVQIVNGIRNFYVDYGRYPVVASETAVNKDVINALTAATSGSTANPRMIRYLEVPSKSGTNASGGTVQVKSGLKTGGDGTWFDPWGQAYVIYIDHDYNDEISVTYNGVNSTLRTGAAAKSLGKSGTGTNPKTDVVSWE